MRRRTARATRMAREPISTCSPSGRKAERLRDETHVRTYVEEEWRELYERAGLAVEAVELLETEIDVEPWLARAGCQGEEAERVRALLADRIHEARLAMTRIAIRGRKR